MKAVAIIPGAAQRDLKLDCLEHVGGVAVELRHLSEEQHTGLMIGIARNMADIEDDAVMAILFFGKEHAAADPQAAQDAVLHHPARIGVLAPALERLAVEDALHAWRQWRGGAGQ